MAFVYLTHQGAQVRRRGDALIVEADGQKLADLEIHNVEALCIFGRVHLTLPVVELLLQREVETAFLTIDGRLKGQLTPARPRNVTLRIEQFRRFLDPATRLEMARAVVRGKLANACELVQRYRYNHPEAPVDEDLAGVRDALAGIDAAPSLDSLRGLEGSGTRAYFAALGKMCRGPLAFSGRSSRPPADPFNALLSLGYVLLANEITHLADAVGLDPYVGFYHEIQDRRAGLALDLVEELRHPLIDRFCLHLNNNRMLGPDDFRPDPERPGGVILQEQPFRRYLTEYDEWMRRSPRAARPSPRDVVRGQIERLCDWLRGGAAYQPWRFED